MKYTYQMNINGMTCHACESLITMDLEEAGFAPTNITHDPGLLTIEIDEADVERVKDVIAATKKYSVTHIERLN